MSKSKYKLFISCDEAQLCCDKAQYKEASIFEKIKLSIHLLFCKACQTYTKNNSKLTELMKDKSVTSFKEEEKASFENAFKKELENLN